MDLCLEGRFPPSVVEAPPRVDSVDQLRQDFGGGAVCKCDTHKALDFPTLRFGTRRSVVQNPAACSPSVQRNHLTSAGAQAAVAEFSIALICSITALQMNHDSLVVFSSAVLGYAPGSLEDR